VLEEELKAAHLPCCAVWTCRKDAFQFHYIRIEQLVLVFTKHKYVYTVPFPRTFSQLKKIYAKGPFCILKIYSLKGCSFSNYRCLIFTLYQVLTCNNRACQNQISLW